MAIHFPPVAFSFSCEGANILLEKAAKRYWRSDFGIISCRGSIVPAHTRQILKLRFRQQFFLEQASHFSRFVV
jgi:hypothetical protein